MDRKNGKKGREGRRVDMVVKRRKCEENIIRNKNKKLNMILKGRKGRIFRG